MHTCKVELAKWLSEYCARGWHLPVSINDTGELVLETAKIHELPQFIDVARPATSQVPMMAFCPVLPSAHYERLPQFVQQ